MADSILTKPMKSPRDSRSSYAPATLQLRVLAKQLMALNPGLHPHVSLPPLSSPGHNDSQELVFLHLIIIQDASQPRQVPGWNW